MRYSPRWPDLVQKALVEREIVRRLQYPWNAPPSAIAGVERDGETSDLQSDRRSLRIEITIKESQKIYI